MPASPIRRLAPLANAAKARGTKVYHLNIGQPDVPTPPEGLAALKNIDRKVLEYSPSDGLPSLRKKLKEYYKRFNIEVETDDIIVTTGGSEAVLFAFMACLDPRQEQRLSPCHPQSMKASPFRMSTNSRLSSLRAPKESSYATPTTPQVISTQ